MEESCHYKIATREEDMKYLGRGEEVLMGDDDVLFPNKCLK